MKTIVETGAFASSLPLALLGYLPTIVSGVDLSLFQDTWCPQLVPFEFLYNCQNFLYKKSFTLLESFFPGYSSLRAKIPPGGTVVLLLTMVTIEDNGSNYGGDVFTREAEFACFVHVLLSILHGSSIHFLLRHITILFVG